MILLKVFIWTLAVVLAWNQLFMHALSDATTGDGRGWATTAQGFLCAVFIAGGAYHLTGAM